MAGKIECFCSIFRAIPVVFITSVIVWSYYAYVIQMCIFTIDNIAEKVIYLVIFHPLLILFLWSYWKTIFTPIAVPPIEFNLTSCNQSNLDLTTPNPDRKTLINAFGKTLPINCRLYNGDYRFCEKCQSIKPDRCHHCSVCGRCILKLDHHCPWVNNCICFSNYKFFILFLGYGLLYCTFVAATSLQYFILFWGSIGGMSGNMNNLHIVFLFFTSLMFSISLLALLSYHIYMIILNRTTIESFQVPVFTNGVTDKNAFNHGCRANFYELFGSEVKYCFLPIFTSLGDGTRFPNNFAPNHINYNSMEAGLGLQTNNHISNNSENSLNRIGIDYGSGEDHSNLLPTNQTAYAENIQVNDYLG